MTELISKLETKKWNQVAQKMHQLAHRIDIFCSAILFQGKRRINYFFNKKAVHHSITKRSGNCLRCGRCCHASIKCQHLEYDEKGLSLCKVYDQKPRLCSLYPYNETDYFDHLRDTCGYKYEEKALQTK